VLGEALGEGMREMIQGGSHGANDRRIRNGGDSDGRGSDCQEEAVGEVRSEEEREEIRGGYDGYNDRNRYHSGGDGQGRDERGDSMRDVMQEATGGDDNGQDIGGLGSRLIALLETELEELGRSISLLMHQRDLKLQRLGALRVATARV